MKIRLDTEITNRGLVTSRSQAESWIKLGKVTVNGEVITKSGHFVSEHDTIQLTATEQYVSRAGLKLASVAQALQLDFSNKIVLDVGSSTGGFTDYALQHGATKVYAVDVGTEQLHTRLRGNPKIELHEKTDIRNFSLIATSGTSRQTLLYPDIILIDVSFISLRDILPYISRRLARERTQIVAMVKPQFEAGKQHVNKGVLKNNTIRRHVLRDFEEWARERFVIVAKQDSEVVGAKGNQERFYILQNK